MRTIKGFTLLEVLVVLVITALISTLLLQGFVLVMDLYQRFAVHFQQIQRGAMQETWFRNTTGALVADYEDIEEGHVFTGNAQAFSGLTLTSLEADNGVPTAFGWQLEAMTIQAYDGMQLRYQYSDTETTNVKLWSGNSGSFSYLAADGSWYPTWPPQRFGKQPPQLPQAIALTVEHPRQPLSWIVNIAGRKEPAIDFRVEFLKELGF